MNSKADNNGPIFIVGAARSGTTLLQYMLRSHPNISLPTGESHFFIPLYQNRDSWGDLTNSDNIRRVLSRMYEINPSFLDTDIHGIKFDIDDITDKLAECECTSIPALLNEFMSMNAKGEGKKRWGDKTPYYILHLPEILEMFPNAKVIHIIRDGRDCALSMLARAKDLGIFNIYYAAYLWNRYVSKGQEFGAQVGSDKYFEFRYEDMLENPGPVMNKLCDFLNEEYSDSLVNFKQAQDPNAKTPLLKKPLQKGNSEKWRSKMTPWQIQVFESMAGDTLVKNNYTLASRKRGINIFAKIAYEAHIKCMFWAQRNFRRKKQIV